jgi:hypothetical protein
VRSYFNLVTKNAVFMRSVAFCKRLVINKYKRGNEIERITGKN